MSSLSNVVSSLSPTKDQRRRLPDSRGISITVPPQPEATSPSSLNEKAAPVTTATTNSSIISTPSPGAPLPRQNSSDDLDGYRSSCEGSVPEEGCHGSHENNSCESSATGLAEGISAPLLSSEALAALRNSGHAAAAAATEACSPAAFSSGSNNNNDTNSNNNNGNGGVGPSFLPAHTPTHRRHVHSRPRSSISNAAREEERQRLLAVSSPAETTPATASMPASAPSTAVSNHKNGGKLGRATAVITPVSLAEASAEDSDCSTADAVCHGREPLFTSTSVKTAAAMLSALDPESREEAASMTTANTVVSPVPAEEEEDETARASKGASATLTSCGDANTSGEMLLRVVPPFVDLKSDVASKPSLSATDSTKSPLQTMLSRLSRSSSNDSSAVEATMGCSVPLVSSSTPAVRSSSVNSMATTVGAKATGSGSSSPNLATAHHLTANTNSVKNIASDREGASRNGGATHSTPITALPPNVVAIVPAASTAQTSKTAVTNARLTSPLAAMTAEADEVSAAFPPTDTPSTPVAASTVVAPVSLSASHQRSYNTSPARIRQKVAPTSLTATMAAATTSATTSTTTTSVAPAKDINHVGEVASLVHTATSAVGPSPLRPVSVSVATSPAVEVSSSSSVGGHHLSVTEGNAFLKQSGSRREEAFYNMIQPYQEALVREAVRQAPHTVEHWRHQNATSSSSLSATATTTAATTTETPVIHHVHVDADGIADATTAATTTSHADNIVSLCDARWEVYQQYEAEDMSSLDILASAPPPIPEEASQRFPSLQRMRSDSIVANSPVMSNCAEHLDAATTTPASTPTSPVHQIDKSLVALAARLWWTIRFRHFYRTAAPAYEVQRQAAEAAAMSPPSPSVSSFAEGTGRDGAAVVVSRCSTPASQCRYPNSPSPGTHFKEDPAAISAQPQAPPPTGALSGTVTPNSMGSFAAPSSEGVASSAVSQSDRQYIAQKHRALQLLAAFVPRYHGTRRLFVRDVLRCERRCMAASAEAAPVSTASAADKGGQNPLSDSPSTTAVAAASLQQPTTTTMKEAGLVPTPRIVDADNDDDDEDGAGDDVAGGRKVCRMIMLEYVCYRFRRPCVMDIKMGSRQYGLHPTAEKKHSKEQKAKLSTSARYGIRLAGYRRWNVAESRYEFRSKLQCRPLTLTEVKNEISVFMMNNRELERAYRRQLQRLRVAFSQQTVFRFYTSSLLFVYDAEDPLPTARVTMVDFAYTYESKELLQGGDPDADFAYDVGYLKAIDTLLSLLA
jgi:hypothetical protein